MDEITVYYTDSYDGKSSHKLLFRCATDYYGISPGEISLLAERGKKPYFVSPLGAHFSISHSGGVWACAFAPKEVGLDIQEAEHGCEPTRLAQRYFHKDESNSVISSSNPANEFTRIWSRKEAVVKFFGVGIGKEFKLFSSIDNIVSFDGRQVRIDNFDLLPDFAAAIAYEGEFDIKLIKI